MRHLIFAALMLSLTSALNAAAWQSTGNLTNARIFHTATLLGDGTVLVAGGTGTADLATVEQYNPTNGLWTTRTPLPATRVRHSATLLNDGRVLMVGGYFHHPMNGDTEHPTSVIYSPSTWTTASVNNRVARQQHGAVKLANGKVLVVGGLINLELNVTNTAEVFDPTSNTWSDVASMTKARYLPFITLLGDGRVLVAAGMNTGLEDTYEIYDPTANTWTTPASCPFAGGWSSGFGGVVQAGVVTLDRWAFTVATTTWATLAPGHTSGLSPIGDIAILSDGRWLDLTSTSNGANPSRACLYDTAQQIWRGSNATITAREKARLVTLNSGLVLAVGGLTDAGTANTRLASCELFDPAQAGIAPFITSGATLNGVVGQALSYQITTVGSTPISFTSGGGSPIGDANGLVSFPYAPGTYYPTITATNSYGTDTLNMTVSFPWPPPVITVQAGAVISGQVGDYLHLTFSTADVGDTLGVLGTLPPGVTNYGSGVLGGAVTQVGSWPVDLTATNAGGTTTQAVTFTITAPPPPPAPTITSATAVTATFGAAFSYQIMATNTPTSFGATGLPAGLTVNASAGVVSGTFAAAGSATFTATATNAGGTGTQVVTVAVAKAAATVAIDTASLAVTADGTAKPVTVTTIPAGLTVTVVYTVDGVDTPTAPSAAGSYLATATVVDANYQGATGATLVIAPAGSSVTPAASGGGGGGGGLCGLGSGFAGLAALGLSLMACLRRRRDG